MATGQHEKKDAFFQPLNNETKNVGWGACVYWNLTDTGADLRKHSDTYSLFSFVDKNILKGAEV